MKTALRRWGRGLLLGLLLIVVVVLVFSQGDDDERAETGGDRFGAVSAGVCLANGLARSGDPAEAERAFRNRAHQPIHVLAAAAAERDRSAAALLLEAKGRVEADLAQRNGRLADDLGTLAAATRRAVAATGEPDPGPCDMKEVPR